VVVCLVVVAVVGLAAHISFQFVTEQNRAAIVGRVQKPESLKLYERLADEDIGDQETSRSEASKPGERNLERDTKDAEETMARYERLFARKREQSFREVWDRLLANVLDKHPSEWTAEERSQVEAFFAANQDLIRELRELAELGGPVYPLDFSKGVAMELPHLAQMRDCARLLRADAIVKAMNGDYSEMVEDVIAGMKLGDAMAQEPILISQLVRIAIYGIMTDAVQKSVSGGDLPPELISQLLTHTDHADNRQAFAESFSGEQMMVLQAFSDVRAGGYSMLGPSSDSSDLAQISEWLLSRLYASPPARPWLNMDEAAYADLTGRMADAAELPYYEASPLLTQIDQDIENLPVTRVLSRTTLPPLSRVCQAQARHEAIVDLLQMGLLIEQYHARQGSYPESLDAIAPGLRGGLPVDPLTGEPYHYRPSGDSFLLYSVGGNLTDDGGTHDWREGDWAWRGESE